MAEPVKLTRDTSTPEGRRIWGAVEQAARLAPMKCGCFQEIGQSNPLTTAGYRVNDSNCLYQTAAEKAARLDKGVAEIRAEHHNILNPPPHLSVTQAGKEFSRGLEFALRALSVKEASPQETQELA